MIDLGLSGFFRFLEKIRPGGLTSRRYHGNRKKPHQGRAKSGRVSQRMRVSHHAAVNRRPIVAKEYHPKPAERNRRRNRRQKVERLPGSTRIVPRRARTLIRAARRLERKKIAQARSSRA